MWVEGVRYVGNRSATNFRVKFVVKICGRSSDALFLFRLILFKKRDEIKLLKNQWDK